MKALIISSGAIDNYDKLMEMFQEVDYILCADGGLNHLAKLDLLPHMVIGDLDSITELGRKYIEDKNINTIKYPSIKDATDTELAIEYLIEKNYKEIILMGGTGTRLDHTMANIFLLNMIKDKGAIGKIIDNNNIIQLLDKDMEIQNLEDAYVSIIPIVEEGINVSLDGFYYDLIKEDIGFASTVGVSNKVTRHKAQIKVHSGKAIIFFSWD